MQIAGSWLLFDDGVTRPVIDADIHGANVILSRRRNEVLLLAPNHQYRVVRE
jgi:hypothetical protein